MDNNIAPMRGSHASRAKTVVLTTAMDIHGPKRKSIRSRTSLVDQHAEVTARRRIQRRRRADDERVGGRCARGG